MANIVTDATSRSTGTAGTDGTDSHHNAREVFLRSTHNGQEKEKDVPPGAALSPGSPGSPGDQLRLAPQQWVTELLTELGAARHGKKWQCPGHALTGDHTVSLNISTADDGRLLMFCHSGCTWRTILRSLHLPAAALKITPPTPPARHAQAFLRGITFPPPKMQPGGSAADRGFRFESEHPYGDDVWLIRLRHPSGHKEVLWESRNGKGERVPGLLGRRTSGLPLYWQTEVVMAMGADEPVCLVESESSVDALRKAGVYATTWAGGAGSPNITRLREVFTVNDNGYPGTYPNLVVVPDFDTAGIGCLRTLTAAHLVPNLIHGEPGEDAKDLLTRIGPVEFHTLLTTTIAHPEPAIPAGLSDRMEPTMDAPAPLDARTRTA